MKREIRENGKQYKERIDKKLKWKVFIEEYWWVVYLFTPKTSCYIIVERGIIDIWHKNIISEWFTYLSFKLDVI